MRNTRAASSGGHHQLCGRTPESHQVWHRRLTIGDAAKYDIKLKTRRNFHGTFGVIWPGDKSLKTGLSLSEPGW